MSGQTNQDRERARTYLEARLLFTRTIPTEQPLYNVLATRLFIVDDDPSALSFSCSSATSDSLAFSKRPREGPSSTSSISRCWGDLEEGERTVIPSDGMVPIDIFTLVVEERLV